MQVFLKILVYYIFLVFFSIVIAVTFFYNQPFFSLGYKFVDSLLCYICTILKTGESSSHINILDLRFMVLWLVTNVLIQRSIFLRSFFVQFKKALENLKMETLQIFIPLIRFLLQSLVSEIFLVLLRYFYPSLFNGICF